MPSLFAFCLGQKREAPECDTSAGNLGRWQNFIVKYDLTKYSTVYFDLFYGGDKILKLDGQLNILSIRCVIP